VATGARPSARLGLALEPVVDRFRGAVDLRTNLSASCAWTPWRQWSFALQGSATSLSGASGGTSWTEPHTTVRSAGLALAHELVEQLRLTAAAGSTWQSTSRGDLPAFREDLVTIGLEAGLLAL
jgi:hypothetical protein